MGPLHVVMPSDYPLKDSEVPKLQSTRFYLFPLIPTPLDPPMDACLLN